MNQKDREDGWNSQEDDCGDYKSVEEAVAAWNKRV